MDGILWSSRMSFVRKCFDWFYINTFWILCSVFLPNSLKWGFSDSNKAQGSRKCNVNLVSFSFYPLINHWTKLMVGVGWSANVDLHVWYHINKVRLFQCYNQITLSWVESNWVETFGWYYFLVWITLVWIILYCIELYCIELHCLKVSLP